MIKVLPTHVQPFWSHGRGAVPPVNECRSWAVQIIIRKMRHASGRAYHWGSVLCCQSSGCKRGPPAALLRLHTHPGCSRAAVCHPLNQSQCTWHMTSTHQHLPDPWQQGLMPLTCSISKPVLTTAHSSLLMPTYGS